MTARARWLAALTVAMTVCAAMLAGVWARNGTASPRPGASSRVDSYLSGLAAQNELSGTVLVAQRGKILLDKGYGLADRKDNVLNSPSTVYPVEGIGLTLSLLAGLKLEEQGKIRDDDRVCSYLPRCPASWKAMTIRMLLDGTAGVRALDWGRQGRTPAESLAGCEAEGLGGVPGAFLDYQNCTTIVLGTIIEKVTDTPWATAMRHMIFGAAGMKHSGRITDSLVPPARAQGYSGSTAEAGNIYNDFFQTYTSVSDVYQYDTALFGGTLISQRSLDRMVAASDTFAPPYGSIANARNAYGWSVGSLAGHRVIYTSSSVYAFNDVNLWFPQEDVAVIVISNDDQNDPEAVAAHLARIMLQTTSVAPLAATPVAVPYMVAVRAKVKVPYGFTVTGGGAGPWVGMGDGTVTRIDPTTNKIRATVRISDPRTTPRLIDAGIVQVAAGSGQVWATDRVHRMVVRIDPATNRIIARVPIRIEPFDLAIAGHTLWVNDSFEDDPGVNTIVRVDTRSQKVVATITNATTNLGQPYLQLAAAPDSLWFSDWASSTVKRLDPATNRVVATIHTGHKPSAVAIGAGSVWTSNHYSSQVTRIDLVSNKVVSGISLKEYPSSGSIDDDCCGRNIVVGEGAAWTSAGSAGRTLVRIDLQSHRVTSAITFPQRVSTMAVAGGSVWVASGGGQSWWLYRVDPRAMK